MQVYTRWSTDPPLLLDSWILSAMPQRKKKPRDAVRPDAFPVTKPRSTVPHEFVLDALAPLSPWTRPMFGCLAIYVGEKIVLILRQKPNSEEDNGVWLATTEEHHESLREDFPSMRSIGVLGKPITGWQVLPTTAPGFEESALHACELVLAGDPRIGKILGKKRASAKKKTRTGLIKKRS